jgi:exodeoxyribonuclease VIII
LNKVAAPAKLPTHIMLDLETFGNGNDAAIVSIGAVKFNSNGLMADEFHVGVDPESCQLLGLKIDASTVMWWLDPERADARANLLALDKVDLLSALIGFSQWIDGDVDAIWGNGATFDNIILRNAYRVCGMEYPVKFWQDQCYRTMKYRAPGIELVREGTHHDALDDARSQAKHLLAIMKYLNGPFEHIERMQADMLDYLPPDGGTDDAGIISKMIYHLDGPEQREVQGAGKVCL